MSFLFQFATRQKEEGNLNYNKQLKFFVLYDKVYSESAIRILLQNL